MPTVNPGSNVSISANAVASRPWWMSWTGASTMTGTAKLPSGHRRLVTASPRTKTDYYVNPLSMASTTASWRVVIFAPNGSYITSSGTGDIPTIGTPTVRIGVNIPSKAVIKYPVLKNNPGNILDSTFAGWSDGHAEAVGRGMELTVEYRDRSSGNMVMTFRGMIYQVESGEVVTVTAYDRMMDLAQYSDQYQSHAGYSQDAWSTGRSISGSNYIYTFSNDVGTMLTAKSIDLLEINALDDQTSGGSSYSSANYYAHNFPEVDGYAPEKGLTITRVTSKVYCYARGRLVTPTGLGCYVYYRAYFTLYKKSGSGLVAVDTQQSTLGILIMSQSGNDWVTNSNSSKLYADVNWYLDDDPSNYCIGVRTEYTGIAYPGTGWTWEISNTNVYPFYSASRLTVSGNFYYSSDGSNWSQSSSGNLPEIAVWFQHNNANATTTSLFTISGNTLTIAESNIPAGPGLGYLSTIDKAIAYIVNYFISGAAGLQGIVKDLIEWAGLTEDVIVADMGKTDYYTSSTYDYLTCIQELISGGKFGMMASITEAGKIVVKSMHTTSETPVASFTTKPNGMGEQSIISHQLTAHWMAEKATQAYIAENVTISGLPIAIETDDALMDNSLVEIMQSPLRSVITDTTLGTHDLMANAAGGKMVQLHTNVFEGKMVLAGYRLDIWDFTQAYCGGLPIAIEVPEYGANGTAVPTEIIIGDGVTQVSLDNIRSAERNEISNSMSKTDDAISNNASSIPNSVYIFARLNTYETVNGVTPGAIASVDLLDDTGVTHTQSNATYIKTAKDNAGYYHVLAVFRAEDEPSGYAPAKPIERVAVTWGGVQRVAVFDNPKYAFASQNVHVDIRFKSA